MIRRENDDFMLVKGAEDENVYIFSKKLKERWFNYLWQSAAAGLATFLVLYIFLELIHLIIQAGVGSTFLPYSPCPATGRQAIAISLGLISFVL